jgi:hypothetical protein
LPANVQLPRHIVQVKIGALGFDDHHNIGADRQSLRKDFQLVQPEIFPEQPLDPIPANGVSHSSGCGNPQPVMTEAGTFRNKRQKVLGMQTRPQPLDTEKIVPF